MPSPVLMDMRMLVAGLHTSFVCSVVSLAPEPPSPIAGMEAGISAATRRNGGPGFTPHVMVGRRLRSHQPKSFAPAPARDVVHIADYRGPMYRKTPNSFARAQACAK